MLVVLQLLRGPEVGVESAGVCGLQGMLFVKFSMRLSLELRCFMQ